MNTSFRWLSIFAYIYTYVCLAGIYLRAVGFAIRLCDACAAIFAAQCGAGNGQRGAGFCEYETKID